jgi:hypothetical protein
MSETREMSRQQARDLQAMRTQLQTLEGRMQATCTLAVKAIQYATDTVSPADASDYTLVRNAIRNLVAWTAEYCKERERSCGLEEVGTRLFVAWDEARIVVENAREPADEEHGNYPSLHYALKSLTTKVFEFVAATKVMGEGGIDARWPFPT